MKSSFVYAKKTQYAREAVDLASYQFRCSIVVSISAWHAEDPGSIPGGGVYWVSNMSDWRWPLSASRCYGSLKLTIVAWSIGLMPS